MLSPPAVGGYAAAVLRYQLPANAGMSRCRIIGKNIFPAPAGVSPALGEYALLKCCATRTRG